MRLVFATNNAHKLEEMRAILPPSICVVSLRDIGFEHDIDETGETLEANSHIKAQTVADWIMQHQLSDIDGVIADDTGLEIMALGGQPGVRTARWSGEPVSDSRNRQKALQSLQGVSNRAAQFRTVITLIRQQQVDQVEGVVRGTIATAEQGESGFGYDPIFIPEGYHETFAQLPHETKNSISHRSRAAAELCKRLLMVVLCCWACLGLKAQYWQTLFAYNNVEQIAVAEDKVYALSDGALFSVEKHSETLCKYVYPSQLNAMGISSIYYYAKGKQLLIGYQTGQIDVLTDHGAEYISGLYTKDITASKCINNISLHDGRAYLATDLGIVTFQLRKKELVDTYYIGWKAKEVVVQDILFEGDSIYAFTKDSMYVAHTGDNLVDYHYWHSECIGRKQPDANKGKVIVDSQGDTWRAGGTEGLVREMFTGERITYSPKGPLNNTPYALVAEQGKLIMLSGGRWSTQYNMPGNIQILDNQQWTIIGQEQISNQTGKVIKDLCYAAIDPRNREHFYVSSYGTGLYEFDSCQLTAHYTTQNTPIGSAVAGFDDYYTRCCNLVFDAENRLYMLNAGDVPYQIIVRDTDDQWYGIPLMVQQQKFLIHTPGDLVIDNHYPNRKWITAARYNPGVILMDDAGTALDYSDDRICYRKEWVDQNGTPLAPESYRSMKQDTAGNIWLGTEMGVIILPASEDFFSSNRCIRLTITDETGETPLTQQRVNAIYFDGQQQAWIGTNAMGIYVISPKQDAILAHYTMANSQLPSNGILSLAYDSASNVMYVGSGNGLVVYGQKPMETGLNDEDDMADVEMDEGVMQRWQLHLSYAEATEVAAGEEDIYVLAGGALFSVNTQDEELQYWDKSQGLNGSQITHIAYHPASQRLAIAYQDGRIDLLNSQGDVFALPDLYMKAGTMTMQVNAMSSGRQYLYLSLPFGIVAVKANKAEIADTYYIGEEASAVEVLGVEEIGDSLYALTKGGLYRAHLQDNLADYHYWHIGDLPEDEMEDMALVQYQSQLYITLNHHLYRYQSGQWLPILPEETFLWVHASDEHLLAYAEGKGLVKLTDNQVDVINSYYNATDGIQQGNTYWISVPNTGLVKIASDITEYAPDGPLTNNVSRLKFEQNHLYVAPGGRWDSQDGRLANLSIYDGTWHNIPWQDTYYRLSVDMRDAMTYAVDPTDASHFYVSTYGTGVIEFQDYHAIAAYSVHNSTLQAVAPSNPAYFTRTDGTLWDDQNNLWVLNTGESSYPINILTPQKQWVGIPLYSNGQSVTLTTPGEIWVDQRNPQRKWLIDQRYSQGVILVDDRGTPTYSYGYRCIKRSSFTDQDGNLLTPSKIYCLAQDRNNDIWIGTATGIIVIPSSTDFFSSNTCKRIKIARHDGTNLADYLLGTEQVKCIAVDGANRKWVGTANSGLYLLSADSAYTIAHFTMDNSLLPSNTIQSIAIQPNTGEVWVGTANGIASYRSDASEPNESFSSAYAYPNPVRSNYTGMITITGLVENSMVNIIDENGQLVCQVPSNGGSAVWDGKNAQGKRAHTGVYTALCNTQDGQQHAAVKILFIH